MAALRVTWEAADCLCSKRFQPFLPELAAILKRYRELSLSDETEARLKLIGKSRHRAKVHKVYDTAQTSYQRLLVSGILKEEKR
jgi:hypothetical protein